jgi:tRNA (guanine37-N1)-methyltransferase
MKINIITLFPNIFESFFGESIIHRAQKKGVLELKIIDLRNFTNDNHKTVDKKPFGGGAGMLMMIEPIYKCLKSIKVEKGREKEKILLTSPKGEVLSQKTSVELSELEQLTLICGHYEGVDHRVVEHLVDAEISIGKYILSGGEVASMVIVDAVSRLIKGSLGNPISIEDESFSDEDNLEYPQYTRPEIFVTDTGEQWKVPEILLSGNHAEIEKWKKSNQS